MDHRQTRGELSDESLVIAAKNGDNKAFEGLVVRYQESVRGFLLARSFDTEVASDLTQDTFLSGFERLNQLRDPVAFRSWIFRIARNSWYMYLRHRRARPVVSLPEATDLTEASFAPLITYSHEIEYFPQQDLVRQVFRDLPPQAQEVLYFRHILGFTNREIAEILEVRVETVKKRAQRAATVFAKRYAEMDASSEVSEAKDQSAGMNVI